VDDETLEIFFNLPPPSPQVKIFNRTFAKDPLLPNLFYPERQELCYCAVVFELSGICNPPNGGDHMLAGGRTQFLEPAVATTFSSQKVFLHGLKQGILTEGEGSVQLTSL
jgi:hypothetical protein